MPDKINYEEDLVMRFDPNTIQHLGVQMYSTLPPVIAEVVANAYDADAEKVKIFLNDEDEKMIIVEDDGHGMEYKELNPKFLLIGRNRRERDKSEFSQVKHRPVIGKKGLGKLSFFGISGMITVETVKKSKLNSFSMDLDEIKKAKGEYRPKVLKKNEAVDYEHGTIVRLSALKRKSAFAPKDIARSLARAFLVFDEADFDVEIFHNGSKVIDVTTELRYEGIPFQFVWEFPLKEKIDEYKYSAYIKGKVISSENTVPSYMRGIALFSRGKLVNDHSFYDVKATSHGYSYITGWLDISFTDDWDKDVISTNRRSLNWEDDDTADLKEYLNEVIISIYNKQRELRAEKKKEAIKKVTGVDIDVWINSLPKHDGILARKIVGTIVRSEELDEKKAGELVTWVKDSFQFESFKEFAAEMDEVQEISDENLLKLLHDWRLIEAREFYKLSLVRVETIIKFEEYIKQKVREVPTMHNFLKQFPWLLDPRIIEFRDEVHYSDLLQEKYPEADEPEQDRRIDFLCTSIADNLFVIELKRPGHKIREKDLSQANDYQTFMESLQGNEPETAKAVIAYIVCGEMNEERKVASLAKSFRSAGKIYVKTYWELLTNAKAYHNELIKKYEEFEKMKAPGGESG